MKIFILFSLICSFGGSTLADSRSMTDQQVSAIVAQKVVRYFEGVSRQIVDAGLDPLEVDRAEYKNAIVPGLLEINASVDNLSMVHLSKISVDSAGYIPSMRRLGVDLSQTWTNPLNITIGNAEVELTIFNNQYKVELSGNVLVERFVFAFILDFDFDNGISVTNVIITFYPGEIQPKLSVKALGNDYSEAVNNFLEYRLVGFIYNNRNQIESYLASLGKIILNALLRR